MTKENNKTKPDISPTATYLRIARILGRMATKGYGEDCPICGEEFDAQCRCMLGDRRCKNNHWWFQCPVHHCLVLGKSDHTRAGSCQCYRGYQYLMELAMDETLEQLEEMADDA